MKPSLLSAACAMVMLASCSESKPGRRGVPATWEVGYWYWRTAPNGQPAKATGTPDLLYVEVGGLSSPGLRGAHWPSVVPEARDYLATWRANEAEPPPVAIIPQLVAAYGVIRAEAAASGRRLVGLQLDVDCPTRSLAAYGAFLRRLRADMPSQDRVSVTALLDWFRPGTRVREVLANVDEYVPQFYDASPGGPDASIGEPLDPARWAPVFNALGCPYRIGLSTFGRIQRVRASNAGAAERTAFRDLTLLDLAGSGLGAARSQSTRGGERLLRFEVARVIEPVLRPGDGVEVIVPTRDGVRNAYAAARGFGGFCFGVVFFRWPLLRETLTLTPDEVAEAVSSVKETGRPRLETSDGDCHPRSCMDLHVHLDDRFPAEPLNLQVKSSVDVEYLIEAQAGVTLRQVAPRTITIAIPPFLGERDVLVGRAFSRGKAAYDLVDGT